MPSVRKYHGKMWYNFAVPHFAVPNFAPANPPPPRYKIIGVLPTFFGCSPFNFIGN